MEWAAGVEMPVEWVMEEEDQVDQAVDQAGLADRADRADRAVEKAVTKTILNKVVFQLFPM